jgi:hypothetical protein
MLCRMKQAGIAAALVLASIVFGLCSALAYEVGSIPRGENLLVFETPHFRIIHQESLSDSTHLVAQYAEEAYIILTGIYRWKPRARIDFLYVDSLDTHNGWATVVPHNTILIYAAGAEQGSSIYAPGNDLRRTIFHELTHILNMDMRFGYNRFLSGIFGKLLPFGDPLSGVLTLFSTSPAALAPAWYLEGQAIWAETEFAPPGRGDSPFVDMMFRCAVRDANLLPYSKWYLEIPHWPYGAGAYIYGARLMDQVESTSGKENAPGDLNEEIARGLLFANSRAARRATGQTFPVLAAEAASRETALQRERLSCLNTLPTTHLPRLTPHGMTVGASAVLGPQLYFLAAAEEETSRLYTYDPIRREVKKTSSSQTTPRLGNLSAAREARSIFYTRLNVQKFENLWYEVRRYDPESGDDSLVTDQGRYRAIDISPDGRRIAAVSQRGGKAHLVVVELDLHGKPSAETVLLALPPESDLSSPRYSPDGTLISYVEADRDSFRLKLYNPGTRSHAVLFSAASQIIAPTWHPSGDILVFSSDLNGVFNLYEIGAGGETAPSPLTHVTGGLFFPVFSEDGHHLFATSYDGFGPHLTQIPYPGERPREPLPVITTVRGERKDDPGLKALKEQGAEAGLQAAESMPQAKPYRSFTHIRFDYWSPWLTASADGVQGGVGASFSDPTRFQNATVLAGIESRYDTPVGGFFYTYRGFLPELRLYASAEQNFYYNLLRHATTGRRFDHAEEVNRYGASLLFPLASIERRFTFETGYEYKDRRFISEVRDEYRGFLLSVPPSEKNEGLLWGRVSFFNGKVYGRSSSVEDGRHISLGAEWSRRAFGGDIDRSRYLASWNEYLPVPFAKNHVLKLSALYGFGQGDRVAQGLFGLGGMFDPIGLQTPGLPDRLPLRGYQSNFQTGDRVARGAAAYRFPISDVSRGDEGTFPVYYRQLFAELFYEGGRIWRGQGGRNDGQWLSSVGAEVNYAIRILRYVAFAPGIGVAYAPQRTTEEIQPYISIKGWINF